MSLDPAPTLLCVRKGRAVGSVCDSRAKYFFELSTHTIVYLQSHVHNRDIATSVKSFLQRDVASFSARRCGGPGRSLRRNGRPHRLLKQKPRHRCRGFAFLAYRLEWLDGNPFRACRRSRATRRPCSKSSRRRPSTSARHDRRRGSTDLARRRYRPAFP